ncbi:MULTISPECIES: OmpA family protein [unclassified Variovorax]|uniref:OmpA family protein n=1 Tax=unclassified Variovorax TaxID=663243 RepID=UPI001BD64181|nr:MULTISPECIES: OmpA family protein [unclassified Variovorax]
MTKTKTKTTTWTPVRPQQVALTSAAVLLSLALAGCAAPKASTSSAVQPFDQAIAQATDALVAQTHALPSFLSRLEPRRTVMVDPMIDVVSGARTETTQLMQKRVIERLGVAKDTVEVIPFEGLNLSRATYLLTGTVVRTVGKPGTPVQIKLALTELRNGKVAAQATTIARDDGLDGTPLAADQDSPVLAKDKVVDGYVRTTSTLPGEKADPYYMEHVVVAPAINTATEAYATGRYADALAQYSAAAALPAGDQLRVLTGVYLSLVKLNRMPEAEAAFGKVVSYGIDTKQLGVKFLFTPGSTAFWPDPAVSGQYGMWLDQVATKATAAKVCMSVVGHTSRTGSQEFNDTLSLQRGTFIREQLIAKSAVLADRTRPDGKGYRENIVGSGTDNAVDALDRRVEFKVNPC